MKTKALLLGGLLACCALTANAQEGFRAGITAGMNVTNITDTEMDCRIGFNAGARFEYNFNPNLYLGWGVQWSMKGNMKEVGKNGAKVTVKNNAHYLEIPVNIGGRIHLSDDLSLFGETGPYFAVGTCGKTKADATVLGQSGSADADFFGDNGANRFDAGWGLRAGVEVSSFQIHLGYEYGFTKVWDDTSAHNWNFNVGVTYMF